MQRERIIGTIGFLGGIMSVPTPFCFAFAKMLAYSKEALCGPSEHIEPDYSRQSLHDYARNELASRMQGDWLVMLDTDTDFEADFCARLVSTMYRYDVDVLTGVYSFKVPPFNPVLYMRNTETDRHEPIKDWDPSSDLFQVDAAGGGCLCVRRRVFDRICSELKEQPFERMGTKGEDFSFFRRLQALKIPVFCAWKIEMVHLEYQRIRTSNFYSPEVLPTGHEFQVAGKRFEPARAGV